MREGGVTPASAASAMEPALEALEWGKIAARLAAHASSEPGRARCALLRPGTDLEAIRRSLEENGDARRMLAGDGPPPLEGLADIGPLVEKAEKGAPLSAAELLLVGGTARAGERVRRFFAERRGRYPRLAHHAGRIPSLRDLVGEIDFAIDEGGTVLDRASPVLASARRRAAELRERLKKTADAILSSPRYARHIQEAYVTVRAGRLVIPFKASAKGRFAGIVHDTSQSGQTVFFEPEELVHLNNEARLAEIEVERETAKILSLLSARAGARAADLRECLAHLAEIDFIVARARLAEELCACEPAVNASGDVVLRAARHPLLILHRKEVVPNDIRLAALRRCLVLTGPNAGGKTVALKTLGLLTLMAMAGLSVPARADSSLSVFERVFVSLGDEQSLERDLSTYSAHIRRLTEILAGAERGSLVLLDEVVSGTDPREGAAIARAFLEALAERDVRILATTHFEELKAIALSDPRFENGSMEFDPERLTPTYRLREGVPGRSMAMEIARSLGFPGEILKKARAYLGGETGRLAEALERLERERERLAAESALLATRRKEEEEARARYEKERERVLADAARTQAAARARIREELARAEEEIRAAVRELSGRDKNPETVRKAAEIVRKWREKTRETEQDPALRAMISRTAPLEEERALAPGEKVFLSLLRREGEVAAAAPAGTRKIEVATGGVKVRVPREQVRVFPKARDRAGERTAGRRAEKEVPPSVFVQTAQNTLDLRGMYVDEALAEIDAFLDRLFLAQAPYAFIIHGHGTGALKAAVRRHLAGSSYAQKHFAAPPEQGGEGATIVVLV